MTKEELWKNWADPSDWAEYNEIFEKLEETKQRFFKDLDTWYLEKTERLEKNNALAN